MTAGLGMKARVLTVVVILSNVVGNLLLSVGMKASVTASNTGALAYVKAYLTPAVILGVSFLVVWMLSRMALMSWADLSFILPVTSVGYVLSVFAGAVFLAEHISAARLAGTLMITAGMILVSRTAAKSTRP
jgi:uncharacterized membrane protein